VQLRNPLGGQGRIRSGLSARIDHSVAVLTARGTTSRAHWYLVALNIKDASVHEAVKQIARIPGESQSQAVATAVKERLARLQKDDLAARLLAIGHKTANRMSPDTKALDHAALLYDERGLPA
jgi:antitoxin VapB